MEAKILEQLHHNLRSYIYIHSSGLDIFRMLEIPLIPSWRAPVAFLEFLHSEQIEWVALSDRKHTETSCSPESQQSELQVVLIFCLNNIVARCDSGVVWCGVVWCGVVWCVEQDPGVISPHGGYLALLPHILSPPACCAGEEGEESRDGNFKTL